MLSFIEDKISKAYKDIGLSQGWSFLYTGKNTFTQNQKLMFVGLNPGGEFIPSGSPQSYKENRCLINDNFNAYLDEKWANIETNKNEGFNPLQHQIHDFYEHLYNESNRINSGFQKIYGSNFKAFMRSTLTLNYIPFRSKDFDSLEHKKQVLEFCKNLWKEDILSYITPSVIIVMNEIANNKLALILNQKFLHKNHEIIPTGWGKTTYSITNFSADNRNILLAKCPHLSRYKLFKNENCKFLEGRKKFISILAEGLSRE